MIIDKINLEKTSLFSPLFLDYLRQEKKLEPFWVAGPTQGAIRKSVLKRQNFDADLRSQLVQVLKDQYSDLDEIPDAVSTNIEALGQPNSFTITTGHQLNVLTGPLFFIYKILTISKTARILSQENPDIHVVPIYWMATEDHDFDEIDHVHVLGETYRWVTNQSGPVGRFEPREVLDQILGNIPSSLPAFEQAYGKSTLAGACRYYVNQLLGHLGVVVLDADDSRLKRAFVPYMKADLFDQETEKQVVPRSEELVGMGYDKQIHCREVNLFWMEDGLRTRIERIDENTWSLVDVEKTFTRLEMEEALNKTPEKFSPNVALRPLYQEVILPNLAYVGGPSELTYWLQLGALFSHHKIPQPVLMPRNFGLVLSPSEKSKWKKIGLSWLDLFSPAHVIKKNWLINHSAKTLSLGQEIKELKKAYDAVADKVQVVDTTLVDHVRALEKGAIRRLEVGEKKLLRAEKRNHSDAMNQIDSVLSAVFPQGTLQERFTNVIDLLVHDPSCIDSLYEWFDPFDFRLHVIEHMHG